MQRKRPGRLATAQVPIRYPVPIRRIPTSKTLLTTSALWLPQRRTWSGLQNRLAQIQIVQFVCVFCAEHRTHEFVPSTYYSDLRHWYGIGVHPRFSVERVLRAKHQTTSEIARLVASPPVRQAMRRATNEKDFAKLINKHLFVLLRVGRRRLRVRKWFRDKFVRRAFSSRDFFQVDNQELRRLVLQRGTSITKVISRLTLVSKDEEGRLYDLVSPRGRGRSRYLYVKCPSTGQEYLLGVPNRLQTPRQARRWSFNLPAGATFAQET